MDMDVLYVEYEENGIQLCCNIETKDEPFNQKIHYMLAMDKGIAARKIGVTLPKQAAQKLVDSNFSKDVINELFDRFSMWKFDVAENVSLENQNGRAM